MSYERLIIKYQGKVKVKEMPLKYGLKGLYRNGVIIIDSNIGTNNEKACILCEELGHHFTTHGNILDLSDIRSQKQELRARAWAYKKLVSVTDLINAYKHGVKGRFELAEFLNVPEWFLQEAIEQYRSKHGTHLIVNKYIIYFEPSFGVCEFF